MPSRNFGKGKPWRARISRKGKDLYLGYYDTYAEAKEVEIQARNKYRDNRGWNHIIRDRNEKGQFVA